MAIAEYAYRYQAELAAGFLRDAGIAVRVESGDGQAAGIGMVGKGARVWVRGADEEAAREVLEARPDPYDDGYDQSTEG